jgi:orotidine-5'-phosphate decarboxylase
MSGYIRTEYTQRPFVNSQSLHLAKLMEAKKSNICLAADVKSMAELIKIAEKVGEHIVVLKTHIDTYEDFSHENVRTLQALANKHNFIIFEDRKFCDIGNTVKMQYAGGVYKIAEWAPITNALIASGQGVIEALKEGAINTSKVVPKAADNAFLLLAEMSSKNNNFTLFLKETIQAAVDHQDKVIGFVAQRSFGNPSFLYMTPGVNAIQKKDSLDQTYRTPDEVINTGADVLIIGRGIYEPVDGDPVKAAKAYQEAGWKAHLAALNTLIKVPEDISAMGIKSAKNIII